VFEKKAHKSVIEWSESFRSKRRKCRQIGLGW